MEESYVEGLATHSGPESCVAVQQASSEALTGVRAGRVLSRENHCLRSADVVGAGGRPHLSHRYRKMRRNSARSETPCTHGNTSRENREVLSPSAADGAAGRIGKSKDVRR